MQVDPSTFAAPPEFVVWRGEFNPQRSGCQEPIAVPRRSELIQHSAKVLPGVSTPERSGEANYLVRRPNRGFVFPGIRCSIVWTIEESIRVAEHAYKRASTLKGPNIAAEWIPRHAQIAETSFLKGEVRPTENDLGDELLHLFDQVRSRVVQPFLVLDIVAPVERLPLSLE
jgi:hypothetical protein